MPIAISSTNRTPQTKSANARFLNNFGSHFGTQLLSIFIFVAKVANHETHIKQTNVFSKCLIFRDLTFLIQFRSQIHIFFSGPHFLIFYRLHAKKVDMGTPSKSSVRQHGTPNRPSGGQELPKNFRGGHFFEVQKLTSAPIATRLLFTRHHFWNKSAEILQETFPGNM